MEFLNIGPIELLIIVLVMFVLLGPKEMLNTSRRAGKLVRDVTRSSYWKQIWGITQDIRELPQKMMDDADLTETMADIKQNVNDVRTGLSAQLKDTANETNEALKVSRIELEPAARENRIAPPAADNQPATVAVEPTPAMPSTEDFIVPQAGAVPYTADDPAPAVLNTDLSLNEEIGKPDQESVSATGKGQE